MKKLNPEDVSLMARFFTDVRTIAVILVALFSGGWGFNTWVDSKLVWAGELKQYIQMNKQDQHKQNLQIGMNSDSILLDQLRAEWNDLDKRVWRYESRYLNNPDAMPEGMREDIRIWKKKMAELDVQINVIMEKTVKKKSELEELLEPDSDPEP